MRVILAEDSVLFRRGLARPLGDAGIDVIDEVGNAEDLFGRIRINPPDVAIVDIRMPPTHTTEGIDAAIRLRAEQPDVNLLVLSNYIETEYAVALLEDVDGGSAISSRIGSPIQPSSSTPSPGLRTARRSWIPRSSGDWSTAAAGSRPSTPSPHGNATSSRPWLVDGRIKRSARLFT